MMLRKKFSNLAVSWAFMLKSFLTLLAFMASLDMAHGCFNSMISQAKKHAPLSYKMYTRMKSQTRSMFSTVGGCSDPLKSLSGGIHEAIHLDGHFKKRRHTMISGEDLPLLDQRSLFRPSKIYSEALAVEKEVSRESGVPFSDGGYAGSYLRSASGPTSYSQFDFLLNELTAYTQDAYTESRLLKFYPKSIANKGAFFMMSAVQIYLKRAKKSYPAAMKRLKTAKNKRILQKLWDQASLRTGELCKAMKKMNSPLIRKFSIPESQAYARRICSPKYTYALSEVIGTVSCPASCLAKKDLYLAQKVSKPREVKPPIVKKEEVKPQQKLDEPQFVDQGPSIEIGDDLFIGTTDPSLTEH